VKVQTEEKGTQEHAVIGDAAVLAYLADQGCIEAHTWLSRADRLDHPDQMVFDLDPSAKDVDVIRDCARTLRGVLERVGLTPYLKSSGSKGYHLAVPLDRSTDFDTTRAFARSVAEHVASRDPDRFTVEQRKAKRKGRVYIDVMRNGYLQTTIPPYGVRALPGAPVAVPLDWDELGGAEPQAYTIGNVFRRLAQRNDPWMDMERGARSIRDPDRLLTRLTD
jgi:bifunctional non-homologous end joining protein LigD